MSKHLYSLLLLLIGLGRPLLTVIHAPSLTVHGRTAGFAGQRLLLSGWEPRPSVMESPTATTAVELIGAITSSWLMKYQRSTYISELN